MFLPLISASAFLQANNTVALDTFDPSAMSSGWQQTRVDLSVDNNPLKIAGKAFAHGLGTHAHSEMLLRTAQNAKSFHAWVGVDDEVAAGRGSINFEVFADGHKVGESGVLHGGDAAKELTADLTGARTVKLVVDEAGDGIDFDHADWADATFTVIDPNKKIVPITIVQEPTMPIAHVDLVHTEIHGARVFGCTPGNEVIYRIAATGEAPLAYSATGLPQGLSLVAGSPVIRGEAPPAGEYKVELTVSGPGGKATRELTIRSGDHLLAQTPPMGWNSWNVWGTSVTANKVRAAADAFITTHLADFGYSYVNIDDAWEGGRNEDGEIKTNEKFGDMASLASYVHEKGIKLGIYSSPGPTTCAGYTASYKHELDDAKSYAKWGVDYLKYDWCSFGDVPHPDGLPGYELPYQTMRAALDQVPRDIVFSLCQYGMGDVYKWGHSDVGGNLWRTTGDIGDSWNSMSGIGFSHTVRSTFAKPGGWNDPDMLVVGKLGWGDHPRPTRLTGNEQITHISLWSMLAAPLIIGCDLTQLDQFTGDVLMNPEVLDIDQDPLGSAATRRWQDGDLEIWARKLYDGSYAIGLFNRGTESAKIETVWTRDLAGANGRFKIRNVWQRKNQGSSTTGYAAQVPAHGTVLIRVTPA